MQRNKPRSLHDGGDAHRFLSPRASWSKYAQLAGLVQRMMAELPEDRPQDMREVMTEVNGFRSGSDLDRLRLPQCPK